MLCKPFRLNYSATDHCAPCLNINTVCNHNEKPKRYPTSFSLALQKYPSGARLCAFTYLELLYLPDYNMKLFLSFY